MEVWLLVALATLLCLLLAVPTLLRGHNTSHGTDLTAEEGSRPAEDPAAVADLACDARNDVTKTTVRTKRRTGGRSWRIWRRQASRSRTGRSARKRWRSCRPRRTRSGSGNLSCGSWRGPRKSGGERWSMRSGGRRRSEGGGGAREEKERQEQEEYLKLKAAFTVKEEGCDAEEDSEENKLKKFIAYIQETKVVLLEDLAAHFKMKTQDAIDRVKIMQESGDLTGVIDDRGKFIFISREELESVARFIRQQGRVSITDLAANSNKLISLN
jgi:hypothetical protein